MAQFSRKAAFRSDFKCKELAYCVLCALTPEQRCAGGFRPREDARNRLVWPRDTNAAQAIEAVLGHESAGQAESGETETGRTHAQRTANLAGN